MNALLIVDASGPPLVLDSAAHELAPWQRIVTWLVFSVCIFFLAFPRSLASIGLQLGRTLPPVLCSVALVAAGVFTPLEAVTQVDQHTILLLLGFMLIAAALTRKRLGAGLSYAVTYLTDLLPRSHHALRVVASPVVVSAFSAAFSALITNDGACVFMADPVYRLSADRDAPPYIVLLLATCLSANIGSAAVLTGNPQNTIIAANSDLTWWRYALIAGPAAALGVVINTALLLLYIKLGIFSYAPRTPTQDDDHDNDDHDNDDDDIKPPTASESTPLLLRAPAATSSESDTLATPSSIERLEAVELEMSAHSLLSYPHELSHNIAIVLSFVALIVLYLCGFDIGWTTFAIGLEIVLLDAVWTRSDPTPLFRMVDWAILVMFAGIFIVMAAFNKTRVLDRLWHATIDADKQLDSIGGICLFALVIIVLSNLSGNVPVVLLAVPLIKTMQNQTKAWLLLAWFSTVAGNTTLTASAANLIVAEGATPPTAMGFYDYLRIGPLSTVVVLVLCSPVILALNAIVPG